MPPVQIDLLADDIIGQCTNEIIEKFPELEGIEIKDLFSNDVDTISEVDLLLEGTVAAAAWKSISEDAKIRCIGLYKMCRFLKNNKNSPVDVVESIRRVFSEHIGIDLDDDVRTKLVAMFDGSETPRSAKEKKKPYFLTRKGDTEWRLADGPVLDITDFNEDASLVTAGSADGRFIVATQGTHLDVFKKKTPDKNDDTEKKIKWTLKKSDENDEIPEFERVYSVILNGMVNVSGGVDQDPAIDISENGSFIAVGLPRLASHHSRAGVYAFTSTTSRVDEDTDGRYRWERVTIHEGSTSTGLGCGNSVAITTHPGGFYIDRETVDDARVFYTMYKYKGKGRAKRGGMLGVSTIQQRAYYDDEPINQTLIDLNAEKSIDSKWLEMKYESHFDKEDETKYGDTLERDAVDWVMKNSGGERNIGRVLKKVGDKIMIETNEPKNTFIAKCNLSWKMALLPFSTMFTKNYDGVIKSDDFWYGPFDWTRDNEKYKMRLDSPTAGIFWGTRKGREDSGFPMYKWESQSDIYLHYSRSGPRVLEDCFGENVNSETSIIPTFRELGRFFLNPETRRDQWHTEHDILYGVPATYDSFHCISLTPMYYELSCSRVTENWFNGTIFEMKRHDYAKTNESSFDPDRRSGKLFKQVNVKGTPDETDLYAKACEELMKTICDEKSEIKQFPRGLFYSNKFSDGLWGISQLKEALPSTPVNVIAQDQTVSDEYYLTPTDYTFPGVVTGYAVSGEFKKNVTYSETFHGDLALAEHDPSAAILNIDTKQYDTEQPPPSHFKVNQDGTLATVTRGNVDCYPNTSNEWSIGLSSIMDKGSNADFYGLVSGINPEESGVEPCAKSHVCIFDKHSNASYWITGRQLFYTHKLRDSLRIWVKVLLVIGTLLSNVGLSLVWFWLINHGGSQGTRTILLKAIIMVACVVYLTVAFDLLAHDITHAALDLYNGDIQWTPLFDKNKNKNMTRKSPKLLNLDDRNNPVDFMKTFAFKNVLDTIRDKITTDVEKKFNEKIDSIRVEIEERIEDVSDGLKDAVKWTEDVIDDIQDANSNIEEWFENTFTNLEDDIDSTLEKISDKIDGGKRNRLGDLFKLKKSQRPKKPSKPVKRTVPRLSNRR